MIRKNSARFDRCEEVMVTLDTTWVADVLGWSDLAGQRLVFVLT